MENSFTDEDISPVNTIPFSVLKLSLYPEYGVSETCQITFDTVLRPLIFFNSYANHLTVFLFLSIKAPKSEFMYFGSGVLSLTGG